MPRTKAIAAADRRYYEAHKEAILAKKKAAGTNYRAHVKANESPEDRKIRLAHEKELRVALKERKNKGMVSEDELKTLPASCYKMTPKAFQKFLMGVRTAIKPVAVVDGVKDSAGTPEGDKSPHGCSPHD